MLRYLTHSPMTAVWCLFAFATAFTMLDFLPAQAASALQQIIGESSPQQALFKGTLLMFTVSALAGLVGDYMAYSQTARGRKWKYVRLVQVLRGGKDSMTLSLGAATIASFFIYGAIAGFVFLLWAHLAIFSLVNRRVLPHLVPVGAVLLGTVVLCLKPDEALGISPAVITVGGFGAAIAHYLADRLSFRRWEIEFYDL